MWKIFSGFVQLYLDESTISMSNFGCLSVCGCLQLVGSGNTFNSTLWYKPENAGLIPSVIWIWGMFHLIFSGSQPVIRCLRNDKLQGQPNSAHSLCWSISLITGSTFYEHRQIIVQKHFHLWEVHVFLFAFSSLYLLKWKISKQIWFNAISMWLFSKPV